MKQQSKGMFLTILSGILFGLMPILARPIYAGGGNAFSLAFSRMAIGAVFLGLLCAFVQQQKLMVTRDQFRQLIICSIGYGGTPMLLFDSYSYLSAGIASTAHFVYPVLVLLGCTIFYREKMTKVKIICCLLCTAGIFCFYSPCGSISLTGLLIALASGVTYAFYIIYLSHSGIQDELSPAVLNFWLCTVSATGIGIVSAMGGQLNLSFSLHIWVLIYLFGIMTSVIATTAFQLGTKYIGAQSSSLLSTFEPLTSIVMGAVLFQESLRARSVAGILCILLSVVLLAASNWRKTTA